MSNYTDQLPTPEGMSPTRWTNTLRGNRRFRKALREQREPTDYQTRCNTIVKQQRQLLNQPTEGLTQ